MDCMDLKTVKPNC